MPSDWFEQLGGEEHKANIAARKEQEAAERLRRHDALFGVYPGVTLGAPPPKLESPRFEAGDDPAGRDD